jgi:hypothetical protein
MAGRFWALDSRAIAPKFTLFRGKQDGTAIAQWLSFFSSNNPEVSQ